MSCVYSAAIYIGTMRNGANRTRILNEMLEPVTHMLGLNASRALVRLRLNTRQQARMEKLAAKCNKGRLTAAERKEYEAYIQASTLIGILQANARHVIARSKGGMKVVMTPTLEPMLDEGLKDFVSAKTTREMRSHP